MRDADVGTGDVYACHQNGWMTLMAKATTTPDNDSKTTLKAEAGGKVAKSGSKAPAKAAKNTKPNFFQRILNYFKDVRTEMKRVVWPTRNEVGNSFLVVLVTLLFFIFFTAVVDQIVVQFLSLLDKIGG